MDSEIIPCTAVVVTYQSESHIGNLLESLRVERASGLDLEVVVVDNASTDGTRDVVAGFKWVKLVESGGNLGYAAGVNIGSRMVPQERALLVLNPDLTVEPGTVARLLCGLEESGVGVVAPRINDTEGTLYLSMRNEPSICRRFVDAFLGPRAAYFPGKWSGIVWDPRAYESEWFPDWVTGAALLISAECRSVVGEWDERYFLYCEETEFLRRAREAGLAVRYEPTAVVKHFQGGSGTSDGLRALGAVNAVRYYQRYHGPFLAVFYAAGVVLPPLIRRGRRGDRLALMALLSTTVRSTLPRATHARTEQCNVSEIRSRGH